MLRKNRLKIAMKKTNNKCLKINFKHIYVKTIKNGIFLTKPWINENTNKYKYSDKNSI